MYVRSNMRNYHTPSLDWSATRYWVFIIRQWMSYAEGLLFYCWTFFSHL